MNKNIRLVDCTLRDGGHVNKSNFGERIITQIVNNLLASNIDIIELGFLKNQAYQEGIAVFDCIKDAKKFVIPSDKTEYALLAQEDQYDVSKLEYCDGSISHIKVSFHNYDLKEGLEFCHEVIKKGYKCHVNPINLQGYSDKELIDIIQTVNKINPYTFTIVDTFGAMTEKDLNRVVAIVDHNLNPHINIGLHLHENLGLSFSLAQFFTKIKPVARNISIDASLNGMGRVPGNLNLELIMAYLNRVFNTNYDLDPIFDAIDDYIIPIKKNNPWGYSLPYALSAQHKLHRTYAEFLVSKMKLKTKDIQNILSSIEQEQKAVYNKNYIQNLYMNYLCNEIDDTTSRNILKNKLKNNRKVLLLAPGNSLNKFKDQILNFIKINNPIIISANFSPKSLGIYSDYIFLSNIQRYEQLNNITEKLIITSNLIDDVKDEHVTLNFRNLIFNTDRYKCDNALLLLLKFLKDLDFKTVHIAGFDGFSQQERNYYNKDMVPSFDKMGAKYNDNDLVKEIIEKFFMDLNIIPLTPSYYVSASENKKEVINV